MKYRVTVVVEAARLPAIVEAAYKPTLDYDPGLSIERVEEAADLFERGVKIANAKMSKTPPKRGKVKFAMAVGMLADYPEAAKALAAWKNKSGGLHGWDRWLKTKHPEAAKAVWPRR